MLLALLMPALLAVEPIVMPEATANDFYSYMQEAIDEEDWWAAVDFGEVVLYNFPTSPLAQEIPFQVGQAYLKMGQFELANKTLTHYLHEARSPKYFEEALAYKLQIAEFFREGGKRRLFGSHKMPAIMPADDEALEIYDEIIATLPHHEMAARALLGKGKIQAQVEDFKESVESLQLLIRRFPAHELAADAYLHINRVYLEQCKVEHLDPDLLDLAHMNLRKFQQAFPRDARIAQAHAAWTEMTELFAAALFETGEFYERTKKPAASTIYYRKILNSYPESPSALKARERLNELDPPHEEADPR